MGVRIHGEIDGRVPGEVPRAGAPLIRRVEIIQTPHATGGSRN